MHSVIGRFGLKSGKISSSRCAMAAAAAFLQPNEKLAVNFTCCHYFHASWQNASSSQSLGGGSGIKRNYYEILEHGWYKQVSPQASQQEIKTAYYRLCKQFHPDSTQMQDFEDSAIKFIEVGKAYETLSNKETRVEYDRRLFGGGTDKKRGGEEIARDLKRYHEFRSQWRKQARTSQQHEQRQQSMQDFRKQHKFNDADFASFYRAYQKRLKMEKDIEDRFDDDPILKHMRTTRTGHEEPEQVLKRKFHEEREADNRKWFNVYFVVVFGTIMGVAAIAAKELFKS